MDAAELDAQLAERQRELDAFGEWRLKPVNRDRDGVSVEAVTAGLVLTGGSVLTYSTFRYFRVQRCLQQGTFPLNRVGMGAVVVSTSLLTLASLMMTISDEELHEMIAEADRKGSGVVDEEDFVKIITSHAKHYDGEK